LSFKGPLIIFFQEPPALEPPLVRDDVVILVGPDKGKTGRVLWVARVEGKAKHLGSNGFKKPKQFYFWAKQGLKCDN